MVNDSADVTYVFREVIHVCGPAIGKARLPTVDSLHGRHYQAIGADRTQRSSTGEVGT